MGLGLQVVFLLIKKIQRINAISHIFIVKKYS
jgi:hypothetical protein